MNDSQYEVKMENPRPEPSIGAAYEEGWKTLWMEFPMLLLIWLIYAGVGLIGVFTSHFLFGNGLGEGIVSSLSSAVFSLLISWPLFFGICQLFLRIIRRQEFHLSQIFDGFTHLPSIVFAAVIITVSTMVGLIMFVVPGVIIFCKLILTPFLMMDNDLNAGDALALSWRLTSGHTGQIFLMLLLAGCIMFTGMMILGLGIIPAGIWVMLTVASFYNTLTAERV